MVSVITSTVRQEFIDNVFQNFECQLWEDKELIIILNRNDMDITEWKEKASGKENIQIYQLPQHYTLGDCLNFGVEKANYDYIAKFDDDDYYSPYYLKTMLPIFNEVDTDIIGKTTFYAYMNNEKKLIIKRPGKEHTFTKWIAGGTIIFKKAVYETVKFGKRRVGSDVDFLKDCLNKGFKIYAGSKNNYVMIRRNSREHTWKIDNDLFMRRKGKIVAYTNDYKDITTKDDIY
ncbi:glycosyltransferase [Pseudalkalibacillus caeni]|uniref:Glycosyltransferase n=1 Tax=Exobacillus caeni TaxID=2574798 RepID=A0A5R9F5H8_9BACL|nr:glycosyltransferase [Pseudalkalibacillus caeni]TLS36898.1 glycosyltransferase [Pseudalkalibacillus caeni]